MEIDDDFGDLYADVEVRATTAVNGVSSSPLGTEQEIESDGDEQIQGENEGKGVPSAEEDADRVAGLDNASESEDDLNIVLNDDDENSPAFPVAQVVGSRSGGFDEDEEGGGSEVVVVEGNGLNKNQNLGDGLELMGPNGLGCQERRNGPTSAYQSHNLQYKYMKSHAAAFPTISKASRSAGMASYFSTSVRGDLNDDECCAGSSSVVARSVQNFSLPWYRSIVDVKIDTFEQKPWRHPGADLTDFFNFGFNEESWKCYCDRMEQVRHQTSSPSRIPTYDCSKSEEAFDAGTDYEKGAPKSEPEKVFPSSEITCREIQQFGKPKGRAIAVENSTLERQPSMDVRRSVARDSDVVIQITLQDSMEDSSGSGKELACKEGSVCEASENGNISLDDNLHHSGSVSADELSRESLEGNVERSSKSVLKRCSLLKTASNAMPLDSDNHGSGPISDIDGHLQQNVTLSSSERNTDAIETLTNREEKVCRGIHDIAPDMVETESFLGEQTQCSPRSSYSGSHCEESQDGACTDSERNEKHLRRHSSNSVTKLRESVASDYHHLNNSETHGGRRKSGDSNYYTRSRSSTPRDPKHYSRRLHNVSELRSHRIYDDAFPLSDTDGRYTAYHYLVGHRRRDKRLHGADAYDREDLSYYKEFGEKFSYNQAHTAYSKRPPNRDLHGIGDDRDRNPSKKWDEEEYYHEQRISRAREEVRGRDRYQYERGLTLNPLNCREPRQLVSNYSCLDEERGAEWRRKADLQHQFRRGMENDEFFVHRNYEDDLSLAKYRYFDKERENFDCKCDRHFPSTRRGGKESGRSERKCNSPPFDRDDLWFISNEDEYQSSGGHRSLSSSDKELHTASGERGHDTFSPRNAYNLGLTERHGRHKRQIWMERTKRIDCFGSNSDAVNTEGSVNFCDVPVHFRRRRHYWKSESFHWTEDEHVSRHVDDKFLPEGASFPSERISRHERLDANQKVYDREVKRHRYKLTGEGHCGNHVEKCSNAIHRGKHEQTLLRCRDLGDLQLVVREGKSPGTYSNAGSAIRNKKHENMDWDIDKRRIISVNYNESHLEKAGRNDEQWVGKFPVTQHNDALDMEEGQIMTEDMNEYPIDENFGSEDFAEISDVKNRSLKEDNATTKANAFDMKKEGLCNDQYKANMEKKIGEALDNNRILDMMAKMEKRRERFKEPIALKKENESIPKHCNDPLVEEADNKQQRPARKRRWGGSVALTTKVPVYP